MPTRSKAPRWPHHHASPPKRRRDQHCHHRTAATRPSHCAGQAMEEGLAASRTKTAVTMVSQQSGHATAPRDNVPRAPSS